MADKKEEKLTHDGRLPYAYGGYTEGDFGMLRQVYANTFRCAPEPEQMKLRMALMFAYLRAENIPDEKCEPEEAAERFKFAAAALRGLTVFFQRRLGEARDLLLSVITDSWSVELWPWIECIVKRAIEVKKLPTGFPDGCRREYMNMVVEALYYYSYHDALRERVKATNGLKQLLISIWYLEGMDPSLDPYELVDNPPEDDFSIRFPPAILTTRLLTVYLLAYTVETDTSWAPDFLKIADDQPAKIAEATLTHFKRNIQHLPDSRSNFRRLYDDVHILGIISDYVPFQNALLSQHSVRLATNALMGVVKLEKPKKEEDLRAANHCVFYLSLYLKMNLDETDGVFWTIRSIEAGLIPALLLCDKYLSGIDPTLQGPPLMFTGLLPKQLLYLSVARAVAHALKNVERLGIETMMDKTGTLWNVWTAFKDLAKERFAIFGANAVNVQDVCCNKKCLKKDPERKFKRCSGCFTVAYCSNTCSKVNWMEGGHKDRCKQWTTRRLKGLSDPLLKSDIQSAMKVFQHDCRVRADEVIAKWKEDLKQPSDRPVVMIDYKEYPPVLKTGLTSEFKPKGYNNNIPLDAVKKWWDERLMVAPLFNKDHAIAVAEFPLSEIENNGLSHILTPLKEDEGVEGDLIGKLERRLKSKKPW